MASSRNETAITWSAAASVTISSNTSYNASDAFTFNAEDWDGAIQVNADNAGTPASGDVVRVFLAYTAGDVLGDTGSDYDTDEHAVELGTLDTYATNTPGEDPARKTFPIPTTAALGFKLLLLAPQAASRNIVCRARVVTHRAQ
jgi:hypothetical protein